MINKNINIIKVLLIFYCKKAAFILEKMSKVIRRKLDQEKVIAEQKEKEEQKKAEEQLVKRNKIIELTDALSSVYRHIKPTNIQGQRIVKILENLNVNIKKIMVLPLELQKISEVGIISEKEKNIIIRLIYLEKEISQATDDLYHNKEKLKELLEEEDDQEDREKLNDLETSIENRQDVVDDLESQYKEEIQELIRYINNSKYEKNNQILDSSSKLSEISQIFRSLYFIYLKKLSTSYEEEQNSKKFFKSIQKNITEKEHLEKKFQQELETLNMNRENETKKMNEEIFNLQTELENISQKETHQLNLSEEMSTKRRKNDENQHMGLMNQANNIIHEEKKKLEQVEKLNLSRENDLIKAKEEIENQIIVQKNEFDYINQTEKERIIKIKVE